MRHFIRHPIHVPLEIAPVEALANGPATSRNISQGGLAFELDHALEPGSIAELRIACVKPPFLAQARVAWCVPSADGFELGVEFLHPDDENRARMVEQVCYIQAYWRRMQQTERPTLTFDEAAREWIARYASRFFDAGPDEDA